MTTIPLHHQADLTRALVAVETAERTMRLVDDILAKADHHDWVTAVAKARDILDDGVERTTTTTVSLVKDQTLSDKISGYASAQVAPLRARSRS